MINLFFPFGLATKRLFLISFNGQQDFHVSYIFLFGDISKLFEHGWKSKCAILCLPISAVRIVLRIRCLINHCKAKKQYMSIATDITQFNAMVQPRKHFNIVPNYFILQQCDCYRKKDTFKFSVTKYSIGLQYFSAFPHPTTIMFIKCCYLKKPSPFHESFLKLVPLFSQSVMWCFHQNNARSVAFSQSKVNPFCIRLRWHRTCLKGAEFAFWQLSACSIPCLFSHGHLQIQLPYGTDPFWLFL